MPLWTILIQWQTLFTEIYYTLCLKTTLLYWRRQLWDTRVRALSSSNNLMFFTKSDGYLFNFVFCDSSCGTGSSVVATETLFSVSLRVILCATKSFMSFRAFPSHQILVTPLYLWLAVISTYVKINYWTRWVIRALRLNCSIVRALHDSLTVSELRFHVPLEKKNRSLRRRSSQRISWLCTEKLNLTRQNKQHRTQWR